MDDPAKKAQEAHLIAQLLGHTSAQMNQLDDNIVGESPSLQKTHDWDPESLLKQHLGSEPQAPAMHHPFPDSQPAAPIGAGEQVPPPVEQYSPPPQPSATEYDSQLLHNMKNDYVQMLNAVMARLDSIDQKLDKLATLDEHIKNSVDRGLKGKMKQVTIKLNDTTST